MKQKNPNKPTHDHINQCYMTNEYVRYRANARQTHRDTMTYKMLTQIFTDVTIVHDTVLKESV